MHEQFPNYLKEMETKRKEKDVIPDDFVSDEELKEDGLEKEDDMEFKPPKPKHHKRPPQGRLNSNGAGNLSFD